MDEDKDWFGRIFENAIGAHLCKRFSEVTYWREGNDEVDFVVVVDRYVIAIEVKSDRRKSTTGLAKFQSKFPGSKAILKDIELGEKFLLSEDPLQFLLSVI